MKVPIRVYNHVSGMPTVHLSLMKELIDGLFSAAFVVNQPQRPYDLLGLSDPFSLPKIPAEAKLTEVPSSSPISKPSGHGDHSENPLSKYRISSPGVAQSRE